MKTSDAGLSLIKRFEGFRAKAYTCPAGVMTIGYGTTRIKGRPVIQGQICSEADAENFLREDVAQFEDCINKLVKVELNQSQFDALVSFVYNVGCGNFKSSTMLKLINSGDFEAAREQFPRWSKAGSQTLPGLVARREAEAELFV